MKIFKAYIAHFFVRITIEIEICIHIIERYRQWSRQYRQSLDAQDFKPSSTSTRSEAAGGVTVRLRCSWSQELTRSKERSERRPNFIRVHKN